MTKDQIGAERSVTVFGGSGFVGRHVVRALARDDWRVRVACRRPDLAYYLQPLGAPGQIAAVQANLRNPESIVAALRGADAVVNLVGILAETGTQKFSSLHVQGARIVAQAAKALGITNFVQISAIGADPQSSSVYGRTKAEGEVAVLENIPSAVIIRPSVIFGPEDDFFNRFATLARYFPIIPIVGGETKFQPVYVEDVADAVALALGGGAKPGEIYELGGPEQKTFIELVEYVLEVTERDRRLISLSFGFGKAVASIMQLLTTLSQGLFPKLLRMTTDQVELLRHDNVVSESAKAEGRTFAGLGIQPEAIEAIVPSYLFRYRKTGQYQGQRS
ncbi:complex I NDUFA9 subunit family protein (plasmid) [Methylocystis sp. MJC1]|jgi:NADH dehydrogenase|uniref:complex I NDUFA9 subunit family protein n=1 Tax=Methylocystis sp. MJC1 TaxID=2654282 RepID=UPI0013ECA2FE|nr:complex I NDUFA9 subunit family protein [Methylocystis sp. MJC1]KAF2988795.1 NAD(P)H azoreductase [Methylocystis sp. MJC1]MBU6529281.1 complex I NDUFA9 subunit family protein [Methylocystis sp. MJC1]UZX13952.1 complex I NDUFA9 subunit family protein [Methylocystis sp. MJC1]